MSGSSSKNGVFLLCTASAVYLGVVQRKSYWNADTDTGAEFPFVQISKIVSGCCLPTATRWPTVYQGRKARVASSTLHR